MADYPASIPDLTTGVPSDGVAEVTPLGDDTYPHDDHHRDLGQEVEAIATELGTNPSGASADVAARFAVVEGVADAAQTAGEVAAAVAAHESDTSVHGIADTTVLATDAEVAAAVAAEAALARNADNLTSGTVADARIASTIARDSEVTAAISAHEAASDPHPGYLTATEGNAAYQPLDSDLTAIAALSTTAFGRSLLELANAAALLSAAGAAASGHDHSGTYQPLDSDLTSIAALSTTSYGRSLLEAANAAALRTLAGTVIGTDVQAYSAVLAATTASFTSADETKLDGIEAGADVTDATNVNAAGAVMESDTSTASMSFVVDEDDMASDSATKVPTQQSTKAYVDANTTAASLLYRRLDTAVDAADVDYGGGVDGVEAFTGLFDYATDDRFGIYAPIDIPYSATNFSTPTQSNARYLAGYLASTGAQNAEVVYRLRGPLAAGTWSIRLTHSTNTSQGIYTIATSTDGSSWTDLTTIDGYASPAVAAVITDATGLTIPAQHSYVRLKMATKNASSSNYYGAFSALTGVRTA